ncbi:MAG: Rne/Rng family ribonuclease, partial [Planctomycetota bacterium]
RGDRIVVQIIKEGIGTKGPTLTSYPSIPGRFLVAMPGVGQMGVSKNIEDETERRRLRKVLDGLEPPKDVGFIIRTAGEGKAKLELERDFKYLSRVWGEIDKARKGAKAPALLYSEGDLVTRTVRDVWSTDVDRIIVDDPETAVRVRQFFKLLMPRTKVDVQLYEGQVPLFHATGVEREVETMFSRHVPMANGGSLVIDSTEAIVAIDVNTGKFREHGDAEETAFRMDLEAADEVCRQLRLRDLGGIVIVDFIDLRFARHRQALHDRLEENFKRDRAKSRHLMMSEFGIVEITRQRMRPDLRKSVYEPCPWSRGTGYIKTPESLSLDVMRKLRVAAADDRIMKATVRLYPRAALHVLNANREGLAKLEHKENLPIEIKPDESLAADQVELDLQDADGRPIVIESIKHREEGQVDQGGQRRRRRGGRGRSKKTTESTAAADVAIEVDEDGLMLVDDLRDVNEMSEDDLAAIAEKAAKRGDADDPMQAVLEAMSNDEIDDEEEEYEDEKPARGRRRRGRRRTAKAEESAEDEVEATKDEPEDEEDEKPSRGRRRRRGRGRGKAEAEVEVEAETAADDEPAVKAEATDDEDDAGPSRRRRRRRGRKSTEDETAETASADEAPAAVAEPEADDGDDEAPAPRSRRRRRRRGRSADEENTSEEQPVVEETGESTEPAADDDEPPTNGRRRRRRRSRRSETDDAPAEVEAEAEVAEPETDEKPAHEPEEDEPKSSRRGRRRRSRSSSADADEVPATTSEPESEPEPASEPEPEAEATDEASPAKRRRRSRGKLVKSRPIVVESAVPSETPAEEEKPKAKAKAPKKAAKKATRKKATKKATAKDDDAEASKKKATKRTRKKAAKKTTKKAAKDE